ncbi:MAG: hypothetical protein RL275_838 [Chloroflexota bacterium]|jgi:hypothetical protein
MSFVNSDNYNPELFVKIQPFKGDGNAIKPKGGLTLNL